MADSSQYTDSQSVIKKNEAGTTWKPIGSLAAADVQRLRDLMKGASNDSARTD